MVTHSGSLPPGSPPPDSPPPDSPPPRSEGEVLERYQEALLRSGYLPNSVGVEVNELFANYWDMVYSVCYRFVGDTDRANDLAQDTMLRAVDRLHQFQGRSSFKTWLYSIARSICLQSLRKKRELLLDDGVMEQTDPELSTLKRLTSAEREAVLREAIKSTLNDEEQEAVYLRYVERVPQGQIGDILELEDASGGRALLQRCRRKLRKALKAELERLGHGASFIKTTDS